MFNRILVPLDGSEVAEAILPRVEELATKLAAEVVLLEVLPDTGVLPLTAHEEYNETKQYLDEVAQRLKDRGIKSSVAIRFGKPAEEILDYAQANRLDLIAMSTHGRSGVSRWVFGSVAEKVLRGTTVPILLIRAPGASVYGLPPVAEIEV